MENRMRSLHMKKIILHVFIGLSLLNPHLFYDREFSVVIYNTKMFFINSEDVSFIRFPQPPWHLIRHSIFGSCGLKSRHVENLLNVSSMLASLLIQYTASCDSSFIFAMAILLMCSCFSALSCSSIGMIYHFL